MKAEIAVQKIRFDRRVAIAPGTLDGRTPNRPWIATNEVITLGKPETPLAEIPDQLEIVWISGGTVAERAALGRSGSNEAAPGPRVDFESDEIRVEWTPGRAVVQSPGDQRSELLAALTDFAFLEGGLRQLEQKLAECETEAEADIVWTYVIRFRDRGQWRRLTKKIEACTRLRLAFVRLRLALETGAPGLPREGKRLAAALRRKTKIENRLEGFCERLEACEDLYEGANDRIADFRWYASGHLLEIGIIVLLAVEVILMSLELHFRVAGR
jgi:hypothetical protein